MHGAVHPLTRRKLVISVSIVTRLCAGLPGFDSRHGQGFISLHQRVQTGSGAHPATYGSGVLSPEVKLPGCESDHSPPSSTKVKMRGTIPALPHTSSWCGTSLSTATTLPLTQIELQWLTK